MFGRSIAGVAGSNPAGCSCLVFVACCVGSGLCDELIAGSEESYRALVCACMCVRARSWSINLKNYAS